MKFISYPVARVNLANLHYNLKLACSKIQNSSCIVVLKSDAYGHGLMQCAELVYEFGLPIAVARVSEAKCLVDAGCPNRIIVLSGFLDKLELEYCIKNNIEIVFHSDYQIELLNDYLSENINKTISHCWLKFDSGMGRLGFDLSQLKSKFNILTSLIGKSPSLISHLACSDDLSSEYNKQQIEKVNTVSLADYSSVSVYASGYFKLNPEESFDYVRLGLSLYGVCHSKLMKPVMKVFSKVIAIKPAFKGAKIGYGSKFCVSKDTNIGVIAFGYGDGYPQSIQNSFVAIGDKHYPVIGSINMDTITVDLGVIHDVKVGDEVEIFGDKISVETIAANSGTIPYRILVGITARVVREYSK